MKKDSKINLNKMALKKKETSIVKTVRIIIGTVCTFFFLTFLISMTVTKTKMGRDYQVREAETILNSTEANIEADIENYKELSRLVMLNDSVIKLLRAISVDAGMINDSRFGVLDVMNVSDNLDSVIIIRNDYTYMNTGRGTYSFDSDMLRNDEWRNILLEKKGSAVISLNGGGAVMRQDGAPIITIGRAVYDINSQKQTGYLLLNISCSMLEKIVKARDTSSICITDDAGRYLAGNRELSEWQFGILTDDVIVNKNMGKGLFSDGMISAKKIKNMPLIIICKTSSESVSVPKEIVISFLLLMIAFILSTFITASFMMSNFTRPILQLSDAMKTTKESGWMKKIDVAIPKNEIGTLVKSYNSMIEYLNDLFTRLIEKEKAQQKAEMRVLHEQIKPHFLYNSLETISFMAYDAGAPKVYDALETLGSFYRNFLSKGDREISVRREINIVKDYLSLQKLRYGDIIEDEYIVSEDTLEIRIPKLILQPLVENCIYHGIRPKGEKGIIRIEAHKDSQNLYISVYDSGMGMSQEMIENVLGVDENGKSESIEDELSGFGLKGTIDRIRYSCDNRDVVTIESEEGEYTKITLSIPLNDY